MEQILQSLNLGTLHGRFEAQRIEPQAVLNLMEKKFGKKNLKKIREKILKKNLGKNFEKKIWEKILKKNLGKKFEKKFRKKF